MQEHGEAYHITVGRPKSSPLPLWNPGPGPDSTDCVSTEVGSRQSGFHPHVHRTVPCGPDSCAVSETKREHDTPPIHAYSQALPGNLRRTPTAWWRRQGSKVAIEGLR